MKKKATKPGRHPPPRKPKNKATEPKPLNAKQQVFVEHYLHHWNASEAARRAGYSQIAAGSIGHDLLKNTEIKAIIDARLTDLQASANEVITRLTEHARGDMLDLVDSDGTVDLVKAKREGKGRLIRKLKKHRRTFLDPGGEPIVEEQLEIELHDAQTALVQLGKYHKLFTDRSETIIKADLTTQELVAAKADAESELDEWRKTKSAELLSTSNALLTQVISQTPTPK